MAIVTKTMSSFMQCVGGFPICDYKNCSDVHTARPLIMKGMRQPKSTKFSSESEFFMMTDATDPRNPPRFAVANAVVHVCGAFDLIQGNIHV